jgi:hypothetical protein
MTKVSGYQVFLLANSADAAYTIAKLCVRLQPVKVSSLLCDIPEIFHPPDKIFGAFALR